MYFPITQWTQIVSARTEHDGRREGVITTILGQYWQPVYCYLRRKGHDEEQAKDLTQGFFCDVVLGRALLPQADRQKGKFRTFLLTALDHYVTDVHRRGQATKRTPDVLVSLDGMESCRLPELSDENDPEHAFHQAWASAMVHEVLAEVERDCREDGQVAHWLVFEARILGPILHGQEPVPLEVLCELHGIDDAKKASNMAITVKRRFAAAMRSKVAEWAENEDDVENEIRDLMAILSRTGAA